MCRWASCTHMHIHGVQVGFNHGCTHMHIHGMIHGVQVGLKAAAGLNVIQRLVERVDLMCVSQLAAEAELSMVTAQLAASQEQVVRNKQELDAQLAAKEAALAEQLAEKSQEVKNLWLRYASREDGLRALEGDVAQAKTELAEVREGLVEARAAWESRTERMMAEAAVQGSMEEATVQAATAQAAAVQGAVTGVGHPRAVAPAAARSSSAARSRAKDGTLSEVFEGLLSSVERYGVVAEERGRREMHASLWPKYEEARRDLEALTEGGGLAGRMAAELKACHEREARSTSALQKLRMSLAQALAPLAAAPRPFASPGAGAADAMPSLAGEGGRKTTEGGSCSQLVMRVAQLATAHVDAIQTVRGTVIELHEASQQMSDLGETMETMLADCDARVASITEDARKARSRLAAAANASIRTLHAHLTRSLSGLRSTCAALAEPTPKPQAPALPAANVATRPSSTRSSHRWSQLNDILRTAPVELCWAQSSPWQSPRISLVRQYNLAPLDAGVSLRR